MDILLYITAGAAIGFIIGMTGVGGGSLMTPLLLAFGFPMPVAVGTDLLYGAVTKAGGAVSHARQGTVNWPLVRWLAMGSLPASIATVALLYFCFDQPESYTVILTTCLGVMLIATSVAVFFREPMQQAAVVTRAVAKVRQHSKAATVFAGVFLGTMVTLSSVGAGAVGITFLLLFYPAMRGTRVVGTDIAHAVPLTLVAGSGHLLLGNVDFVLLGYLLIGSLPAIWLGTRVSVDIPEGVIRSILATLLFGIGIRYAFF